jgi:hypothetical protein
LALYVDGAVSVHEEASMSNRLVNLVFRAAATGIALYSLLGANLAYAGNAISAPAPLLGVVGGPVGLLAAGGLFGGYLAIRHFRDRR